MNQTLKKQCEKALATFVDRYSSKRGVIGILVTGSYVSGKMDPNSDLDIHVVLDAGSHRERGNCWIDGIEVEYFINPIAQVRAYFAENAGQEIRATACMFAHGKVLYENGDALQKLIAEAHTALDRKRKAMTKKERDHAGYLIDDLRKDLEDVYQREDWFAFSLIASALLEKCVDTFFHLKREYKLKPKQQEKKIAALSRTFASHCRGALSVDGPDIRYEAMQKVVAYVERELGGRRPKEWRLRSIVTNK